MNTMEYRLWVTVPDLPVEDEARWEPFITLLETQFDYGAVLAWHENDAQVILSLSADSEAHATQAAIDAVATSLHEAGLGDHHPAELEVEALQRSAFQYA
jgi:hypothetical protein